MISVRKVDVAERLGELLDKVAAGDSVEIVEGDKPVARIVPASRPEFRLPRPDERTPDEIERTGRFVEMVNQVRAMMPVDLTAEEMIAYREEGRR